MKISISHRLVRYIATYHFLSCFVVFLVVEVNGVSGRPDLRTKLLLQNIRTHLAQKADEIVQQKECESGLTLCKNLKSKEEGDEEKSEEIPPPPKIARGAHKPLIKVSPKDVIQTLMPKAHKAFGRKSQKEGDSEKLKKFRSQSSEESEEEEQPEKKPNKPITTPTKVPVVTTEKPQTRSDVKPPKAPTKPTKTEPKPSLKSTEDETPPKKIKTKDEGGKGKIIKPTDKLRVKDKKPEPKKLEKKECKEDNDLSLFGDAFIFSLDSVVGDNQLCRKHSQIYVKQLSKNKIWSLMMYDATGKLPSGILQGNVNQYGDFDECLSINAVFKKAKTKSKESSGIKGKYCLANIDLSTDSETTGIQQAVDRAQSFQFIKSTIHDPGHFIPRFSSINWGFCVPSACLAEDVENFIKSRLEVFNKTSGVIFDVKVDDENCVVKDELKFEPNIELLCAVGFYLLIISTSLYATYVDTKREQAETGESLQIERELQEASKDIGELSREVSTPGLVKSLIMAFSLKRNAAKLLGDNESKDCIGCINGIKAIFTVMLYIAHKTIQLGMTPYSNRILLTKISNEASTVPLRASIIYTDSFLLISGILTSYNLSREITTKGSISWVKKFVARFIRLTPALLAVVLFYAYVWDHLGSGPIWNVVVKRNAELCQKYMWRNILYIQNFFAFEDMCASQTHQLALDMQLSMLSPLFVYLLHTYDKVGIGILQALFLLSSIMRYVSASNNNLSVVIYHGMSVSQLYKTANLLYAQALYRASPYVLGTIVGYYLKKFEKGFDMPKAFAALGWIIAFSLGFYSVVSPAHLALRDYKYDVQEAAQYAAVSPVTWALALSWLIAACHLGYGGKLNEFLCQKSLLVFSRISYSVYLTQFLVFFYKAGVKRVPEMFSFTGSLNVAEFLIVVAISTVVTLLFDIPMMEIKKIVLDKKHSDDKVISETPKMEEVIESEESSQLDEDYEVVNPDDLFVKEEREEILEQEEEYEEEDDVEDEEESAGEVESEEDVDGEAAEDLDEEEVQPLRRSTRIDLGDDSEDADDKEWFKIESDLNENQE